MSQMNLDKINVVFTADTSGAEKGFKKFDTMLKDVGKGTNGLVVGTKIGADIGTGVASGIKGKKSSIIGSFDELFKGMEKVSKAGMKKITAPIMALGTGAWNLESKLSGSIAKVGTIADTSVVSLEKLRKEAINVSNYTGIKAPLVAEAQYSSISAGVDTEGVADFTKVVALNSKAGFTDMETSIEALTSIMNAYGMESEYALSISDRLIKTQHKGKVTVAELGEGLGRVTPNASQLNVSVDELLASISTMTNKGLKANQTITGLDSAFTEIIKPSKEAAETAEQLGINFNSAHLRSVGWAKFLEEIKEKTGGSAEAMNSLFGSSTGARAMTIMMDGTETFAEHLDDITNSAGTTEKAFEDLLTPHEKLLISIEQLKNGFVEFGVAMTPIIEKATEKIMQFTHYMNQLGPEQKEKIVEVALAFALFFPALNIVSKLGSVILGVGPALVKLGRILGGVVTGPLALFIGSLGLFIGVLWNAEDESTITAQSIGDKFGALGQRMAGVVQFAGSLVMAIVGLVTNGVIGLMKMGMNQISKLINSMKDMSDKLGFDWLSDKLGNGANSIDEAIEKLTNKQIEVKGVYTDMLDNAMYKMDNPMDAYMDSQFKKGKIDLEIGGNKVSMIDSVVLDDKGRIKDRYKKIIEEDRKAKRDFKFEPSGFLEGMDNKDLGDWMPSAKDNKFLEDMNKGLKDASKDLPKTAKEVDKVAEAMKQLGNDFKSATDQIKGSLGVFDSFRVKTTSSYRLLRSAKEREKAMQSREDALSGLGNRGLSSELMSVLHDTGMDSLGDLRGLNRMTDEQLIEWSNAQTRSNQSADRQAIEQVININIDAKNKDFREIENELYRKLRIKGVTL